MTKIITVVTNPELGWDCVVGVYDHNTSEQSIKSVHGKDCILHTEMISHIPDKVVSPESKAILSSIETRTNDFYYDDRYYTMLEDNLEVESDGKSLMEALEGENMKENDQKVLIGLFQEFLSEKHPKYVLKGTPFVLSHDGGKYFTSDLKFETEEYCKAFDEWYGNEACIEFSEWLWKVKSIRLT